MRALLTTALTLAFLLMAAITYVAVQQDPAGGEPQASLAIEPPDLAKLQSAAMPKPAAAPLAPAPVETSAVAPASTDAVATNAASEQPPQPAPVAVTVAKSADRVDSSITPIGAAVTRPAATPAGPPPAPDNSVEGLTVVMPE